jgi:hypothetical protein
MQNYINNCKNYYVGVRRAKEMKSKDQNTKVLLDRPNDMDPMPLLKVTMTTHR